jgi:FKBP-type peptidyl-prolyl cis-trans isomerase
MFKKNISQPVIYILLAVGSLFLAACGEQGADRSVPAEGQSPTEAAASTGSVEVSESELVELAGYFTAQGGGVALLQLDEAGVAALAAGLSEALTGAVDPQGLPQAALQAAFGQAQARAEAVQAGATELPAIDVAALRQIGSMMVVQSGLAQLGFGADDATAITKGFIAGADATEPNPAMEAKMPAFREFIQARVAVAQAATEAEAGAAAAESIAAGEVFFKQLVADAEVQKSDSGLHYKVLEAGSEAKPTMSDKVLVHYKGTLIDGTQFDSSYDRGRPAEFPLNGVVKGFGEGLTKIGPGGKIILYIPSELGYGNSPRPGGVIKPGDTLIFECELIEVR